MAVSESLVLNDLVTGFSSVIATVFLVGTKWGRMQATLETIEKRLGAIEGMFKLVPRDITFRKIDNDDGS